MFARILLAILCIALLITPADKALSQSTPGLVYGQVPTAGQWNSYFAAKQDYIGSVPLSLQGGVMQGYLITKAPTVSGAGFNLSPGTSPASPNNGDLWTTSAGLFAQINGATVGPYVASATGGPSLSGNNAFTGNNTFAGNNTFMTGTTNFTGGFQLNGVNVATGTSGGTVPFLNGNNTWSGTNSYSNSILLLGSGSGTITQQTQAAAGTYNWNWPITAGTSGQVLTSQGGGSTAMTWVTPSSAIVPQPQGRLTLTSATPVMTSSATAAQTIYYAPYTGNLIGQYNGSAMVPATFTSSNTDSVGLSLALAGSANWVANTVYDVFVAYNAATPTLCTGPAWASSTARAAAGSIGLFAGFLVNSNASNMTCRTGASSTISVPQYQATYVGTVATDASTAGQVSFTLGGSASGGTAAFINVWNYYNRVSVATSVIDTAATYTYNSATIRPANNSTTNRITFVSGVSEDGASISYNAVYNGGTNTAIIGVGVDSTTAFVCAATNTTVNSTVSSTNTCAMPSKLGLHYMQALEAMDSSNTGSFNVKSNNTFMTVLRM